MPLDRTKPPYHERLFSFLDRDMQRRLKRYYEIQKIPDVDKRKYVEDAFLAEQKETLKKFISQEEYARKKIKEGLKRQRKDILGFFKKLEFRKVRREILNRYEELMNLTRDLLIILEKEATNEQIDEFLNNFQKHFLYFESDVKYVPREAFSIFEAVKKSKKKIALAVVFLFFSSMPIYILSNYHLVPKNTQSTSISFNADDMGSFDWASGAHKSYGFHTMCGRIVKHQSQLPGIKYRGYEDNRFGNIDANILEFLFPPVYSD